jgi:anti-sigma B factor antagonist
MPLNLESRFCDNVYIIRCAGAIVLGDEVKALEAALDRCARSSSQLVLSISEVTRLDSIGLGLLVRTMTNLRKLGGDLRLAAPSPFVVNLLDLTMLSAVIQTHATEQEAIASFLKRPLAQKAQEKRGRRVLVIDSSPDLCVFIRTVLTQHGFDIKSTTLVRDAKVLLHSDEVDFILVGPATPQLSSEAVAQTLSAAAPKAATLQLSPDFKTHSAHQAAEILLQMFGITPSPAPEA